MTSGSKVRASTSFTSAEVEALAHISAQLLKGAYGPQPQKVHDGLQGLARKARTMQARLEALNG